MKNHERYGKTIDTIEQDDVTLVIQHKWNIGLGYLPHSDNNYSILTLNTDEEIQVKYNDSGWHHFGQQEQEVLLTIHYYNSSNTAFQIYKLWKKRKHHVINNDSD